MDFGTDAMSLRLPLGKCFSSFNMEEAVCNHGFFMMSPNVWIPSTKSLTRPLRLSNSIDSATVTISHPPNFPFLLIKVDQNLSSPDQQSILEQVARMLRISQKDERHVREFHEVHASAKNRGFGRIFRSPSIFEDAIKSILLCNCTWDRTLHMARTLCQLQAKLTCKTKKRGKRKRSEPRMGNFPNAKELARLDEGFLKRHCNLGYRANYVIELARNVNSGKLRLEEFEEATCHEQVFRQMMKINGFGPFACSNVLMCIRFYQKVPADTETVRHLKKVHDREGCRKGTVEKDVEQIYGNYAPYQCLAYWLELLEDYENQFGKLSKLESCKYHKVTGGLGLRSKSNKTK
ncbi:hypothetical protein SLE2022_406370 [Rubroshorea leprosula]